MIIKKIHEMFINEARQSPLLFNDLASMENYISESYAGRSFIELLQNADDAKADSVIIKKISEDVYIVANNGRCFTDEDLLSLCRSGASTKKRNSGTIGYRGIGFKSVVNYSEAVHLVSGEIKTTFSRILTQKELPDAKKTPLIRVPHDFSGERYIEEVAVLLKNGYNTIFIFEVKSDALYMELKDFVDDSLIFLENVKSVTIEIGGCKTYSAERQYDSKGNKIICVGENEKNNTKKWIVFRNPDKNDKTALALKYDGGKVIPANTQEAVIHSFLPTHDRLSFKCKVNSDFSTDPSRIRVVQDEETQTSNKKVSKLIADIFEEIFCKKEDSYGIIAVLKEMSVDPLASIRGNCPNDIIVLEVRKEILGRLKKILPDKKIVLQSDILYDDFERITKQLNVWGIGKKDEDKIPGLMEFLKNMGIEEVSLNECLEVMKDIECTDITRANIIKATIKKTKFGMTENERKLVKNAKLFKFESGVKAINEVDGECVDEVFEGTVTEQLISNMDYVSFAKKVGIKNEQLALNKKNERVEHISSSGHITANIQSFEKKRIIKKWRTVEKNVAAVLELMDDVVMVKDVSQNNIGYDLEAVCKDGVSRYYEVKSVEKLGDVISFSNNEYSTCTACKEKYYLAIASQTNDSIEICFVQNPVKYLRFEKRITRWDWICDAYSGEVIKTSME